MGSLYPGVVAIQRSPPPPPPRALSFLFRRQRLLPQYMVMQTRIPSFTAELLLSQLCRHETGLEGVIDGRPYTSFFEDTTLHTSMTL